MKFSIILALLLIGCASTTKSTKPTPFVAGEEVQTTLGCQMLQEEVKEWNAKHPDKLKKADC